MDIETHSDRPIASFGVDWIYLIFLFVYGAVLVAAFDIIEQLSILVPITLVLYLLTVYLLRGLVPKVELYVDRVQLTHNKAQTKYQWCEIKSMTGTRHYHSFNLLPTFRYGANHFFSSKDERLFSISVFVINAKSLVNYLLIKMVECSINDYVSQLESNDAVITVENIQISLNGIEHTGTTYQWSHIKHVTLKKKDDDIVNISIQLDKNNEYTRLGIFTWYSGILLMGLIDHFTQSNYLDEIASNIIDFRKKMMIRARRFALIAGAVLIFFAFVEIINRLIV